MKKIIVRHRSWWKNREFKNSTLFGLALLFLSLVFNYYAGHYATTHTSNSVTDIILNNIPVYDVGFIFVDGSLALFIFVVILLIYEPKRIPFVAKSLALFIFIRSISINLTHLAPFPNKAPLDPSRILEKITFGGDLFFSGHTGIPFLLALIFWEEKVLRYIFIAISLIFGASVLLGHLHYSIDVFAAYFITYTIFQMAQKIFKKDYKLLQGENF